MQAHSITINSSSALTTISSDGVVVTKFINGKPYTVSTVVKTIDDLLSAHKTMHSIDDASFMDFANILKAVNKANDSDEPAQE